MAASKSSAMPPPPGPVDACGAGAGGFGSMATARPMRRPRGAAPGCGPASATRAPRARRPARGARPATSCASAKSSSRSEQRPVVGGEVVAALEQLVLDGELVADVVGGGLPAVVVDRPRPEHLEVLGAARRRGAGGRRRWPQAGAVERLLVDAVDLGRGVDARRVEDRGQQVDRVAELVADLAARRVDPGRPVDDQRRAHAAEPRVALPQAQRGVARPRPAPRVVVVGPEAAELVDAGDRVGDVVDAVVGEAVLVERADAGRPRPLVPLSEISSTSVSSSWPMAPRGSRAAGRSGRRCG